MGTVWRAWDLQLPRWVAVKVLRPASEHTAWSPQEEIDRFRQEAMAAAALTSPYIVPVYDFGPAANRPPGEDPSPYLVMRLQNGQTLAELLAARGALPLPTAVRITEQICRALGTAHAAGVVHRDIKPANIMVDPDGSVTVLDFGIAKFLEAATAVGLQTATGSAPMGTLRYMAPERFLNHPAEPRTDLYSVGCLLHELLTGRPPFEADSGPALIYHHLEIPPPPLRGIRPEIPPSFAALASDMLAKEPVHRPSAEEALRRLEQIAVDVAQAGQAAQPGQAQPDNPYSSGDFTGSPPPVQQLPPSVPPAIPDAGQGWHTRPASASGPMAFPSSQQQYDHQHQQPPPTERGSPATRRILLSALIGTVLTGLVLALVLSDVLGPDKKPDKGPGDPAGRKTYTIAVAGDFKGKNKDSAKVARNSLRMQVDRANRARKLPFRLKVGTANDFGTEEGMAEAARKLAADRTVLAVIGPAYAEFGSEMAKATDVYAKAGLVVLNPWTPLTGNLGPTTYQAIPNPKIEATRVSEFLNGLAERRSGPTKMAYVSDDDADSEGTSRQIASAVDVPSVYRGKLPRESGAEAVRKVADEIVKSGADALHFAGATANYEQFDQQLKKAGFSGLRMTQSNVEQRTYRVKAPWLMSRDYCGWFAAFDKPYNKRFGKAKVSGGVEVYDAAGAAIQVLGELKRDKGPVSARRAVADGIDNVSMKGTCTADFRFGRDGYLLAPRIDLDTKMPDAGDSVPHGEIGEREAREVELGPLRGR